MRFKMVLVLAILALGAPNGAFAARRALLVGIEDYPSKQIPNLKGPLDDVAHMKQVAERMWHFSDKDIKVLTNGAATRSNILGQFRSWLIDQTKPGDEVLFYYSAHGSQLPDDNGDETVDNADETIVPVDTHVENQQFVGMIRDDTFESLIGRLTGRKVRLMFDSCHSGTMTRSLSPGTTRNDPAMKWLPPLQPIRTRGKFSDSKEMAQLSRHDDGFMPESDHYEVWSAASPSQIAFTDKSRGRGSLFTNRFYDGLVRHRADANSDGVISYVELKDYLTRESEAFCQHWSKLCKAGLTPMLEARKDLLLASVNEVSQAPAPPAPKPDVKPRRNNKPSSTARPGDGAKPKPERHPLLDSRRERVKQNLDNAFPRTNSANISVILSSPSGVLHLGDLLTVKVRSHKPGQLVLIDMDAEGNLTQLFPNPHSVASGVSGKVRPGQTITVPDNSNPKKPAPFKFVTREPTGRGELIALVVGDDVDLNSVIGKFAHPGKDLQVINDPVDYISDIVQQINQPWMGGEIDRQVDWAMARASYEIRK